MKSLLQYLYTLDTRILMRLRNGKCVSKPKKRFNWSFVKYKNDNTPIDHSRLLCWQGCPYRRITFDHIFYFYRYGWTSSDATALRCLKKYKEWLFVFRALTRKRRTELRKCLVDIFRKLCKGRIDDYLIRHITSYLY